jgi:uncharacterized membrane protein
LINKLLLLCVMLLALNGCVAAVVGTAVGVAIEVVKVPFKVGGAVVDVISDGDGEDEDEEEPED